MFKLKNFIVLAIILVPLIIEKFLEIENISVSMLILSGILFITSVSLNITARLQNGWFPVNIVYYLVFQTFSFGLGYSVLELVQVLFDTEYPIFVLPLGCLFCICFYIFNIKKATNANLDRTISYPLFLLALTISLSVLFFYTINL